jgi:hypothetical protein
MRLAHVLWRGCAAAACLALWLALAAAAPAGPADWWYPGKSTIEGSTHSLPLAGPPTWPAHPYVLATPQPASRLPAATLTSSSGFDWGAAAIGAGSAWVLVGVVLGATVAIRRARRSRAHVAAQ